MSEPKTKLEQLTDEERTSIVRTGQGNCVKALRIIDAHSAEVAALVAQLEAAERWVEVHMARVVKAEDELSVAVRRLEELETALDSPEQQAIAARAAEAEARDEAAGLRYMGCGKAPLPYDKLRDQARTLAAEVSRLQSALAALSIPAPDYVEVLDREIRFRLAAEARVTALTCEKAALRGQLDGAESECAALRDSVRQVGQENDDLRAEVAESEADKVKLYAEARELRAEVERFKAGPTPDWVEVLDREVGGRMAAESRLAAANALLSRVPTRMLRSTQYGMAVKLADDIDTHLAAQPATAPARDEAEQAGRAVGEPPMQVIDLFEALKKSLEEGQLARRGLK